MPETITTPSAPDAARTTPKRRSAASTAAGNLKDHRIRNLATFNDATKGARGVAGIYFYAVLDGLVELASATSTDFFKRPHLYVNSSAVAKLLARLRSRSGSDELLPSKEQRAEIYGPLTGEASNASPAMENGDFSRLRDQLMLAAAAFAERVFDTGEQMLRERVRTAHRPFKEYLNGLQGDSLTWSRDFALASLTEDTAYPILRDKGVAAVFSLATPPSKDWPYAEDANADKIVEELARQLGVTMNGGPPMTRERFSNLQIVARTGAEALATIIDFDGSSTTAKSNDAADLDLLITKVYTWGSELKAFSSGSDLRALPAPSASPEVQ